MENTLNGANPPNVSAKVKLLLTLWILGNQESFRGVGDRFGMMKGFIQLHISKPKFK